MTGSGASGQWGSWGAGTIWTTAFAGFVLTVDSNGAGDER